ncbi:MAG: OmpA family protein, partial [Treponema sp.]|nr:OmpA family protein [Treponema sp.]
VMEKIEEMGIENVDVKKTEKGLTISVEKIQFKPESSILEDSEKEKLALISQILSAYPDNDLLITGHTAKVGTPESCQKLSEERAKSVADYLVQLGTKDSKHIFTLGNGARVPIATNQTTEGRTRNRRVEITILDK